MTKISVSLSAEQWNVIGAALNELPRRVSDPIYREMEQQLAKAVAAMPKPEAAAAPVEKPAKAPVKKK
jgi:hypothetical protein